MFSAYYIIMCILLDGRIKFHKKKARFGNLWGLMTLSAKTSENYFLIGPLADSECKLHIPHREW